MYPVTEEYLSKIQSNAVMVNWYGVIRTVNGVEYPFNPSTIVEGSGKVTREICTSQDIEIGTTCSAELDLSLYLENVERYELYNGTVTLFFQLQLENSWETIPLGIFYITEPPERNLDIITIHAYDAMQNFNKDCGLTLVGTPYYLLSYACRACGVELGTTQEEIANLTNGTVETYTYADIEIYTFRDLVGYVASFLCCFAYIGVDNKLYLKQYSMNVTRTISDDWRFDYQPKDYETFYSAISAYFAVSEEVETITLSTAGLTYDLGTNPIIQFNADDLRKSVLTNIITKLSTITYTPFTATVPCDPSLMVGDVLNFTGNHAVDGKLSAITKQVIRINNSMELTCVGSDPDANVLTSREKQISAATQAGNKDGMYYYDYVNTEDIEIDDGATEKVIKYEYVTSKATHVDFHAEIKCLVETTEDYDEETDTYTERDGVIYVTYKSGGDEVTEYYPVDTFFDGVHLLHLTYTWWASANLTSTFEVFIRCVGCSLTIEQGASRGYIAGVGLIGDDAWDGAVHVDDSFTPIDFGIIRKGFEETVVAGLVRPDTGNVYQSVSKVNFYARMLKGFTQTIGASRLHRFSVPYNQYEMVYDNVIVSGNNWIVENTENNGFITTPNCAVDQILRVTSVKSGDVAYVISFDNGETWWTYANGWVELDVSQAEYGMSENTMQSITSAQWAVKLNGTIMIRAVLMLSATLTDIQIYTEVYQ